MNVYLIGQTSPSNTPVTSGTVGQLFSDEHNVHCSQTNLIIPSNSTSNIITQDQTQIKLNKTIKLKQMS